MRSVSEHLAAVLAAARPVRPLDVVLADAGGCVLAEDVTAARDLPQWDVAGCDGYAVRLVDLEEVGSHGPPGSHGGGRGDGTLRLPVVHDAAVTAAAPLRLVPGSAILVAAGAPVPLGADVVVPLEVTDRGRSHVVVRAAGRPTRPGENIRDLGRDVGAGQVVLEEGTRLAARHLAVAAALGRGRLRVHPAPRVVVVTVGDELVEAGRARTGGAIFDADGPALAAAVKDTGASAVRVGPVGDDRAALREVLADQLVRADLVVVAGGLSPGPWDTVADVLGPLGTIRFDQVAMTPGHRQGFGVLAREEDDDVPVFALPGHPVAAMVSFEAFVRPALRAMAGHADLFRPSLRAAVTRPWASPAGRRQFVPAHVVGSTAEGYVVTPVGDPEHLSLVALAGANALAVVPEDATAVETGDLLACLVLEG
ncbi:MAG: molybdopterin molybdotransferase MoeA [Actinotalea sp.]|nr:molybdopterin molybdotransferase MoeA [Actinotalea sp.]